MSSNRISLLASALLPVLAAACDVTSTPVEPTTQAATLRISVDGVPIVDTEYDDQTEGALLAVLTSTLDTHQTDDADDAGATRPVAIELLDEEGTLHAWDLTLPADDETAVADLLAALLLPPPHAEDRPPLPEGTSALGGFEMCAGAGYGQQVCCYSDWLCWKTTCYSVHVY